MCLLLKFSVGTKGLITNKHKRSRYRIRFVYPPGCVYSASSPPPGGSPRRARLLAAALLKDFAGLR